MSPEDISALIAGAGFLFTLMTTGVVVGVLYGGLRARLESLERGRADLATRGDVQRVETQVAEIRGMFTLTLRNPDGASPPP